MNKIFLSHKAAAHSRLAVIIIIAAIIVAFPLHIYLNSVYKSSFHITVNKSDANRVVTSPDGWDYLLSKGKQTKLIGLTGNDLTDARKLNVPDKIDDHSIQVIGAFCFSYAENVRIIQIPDSITAIEKDAFYNCKSLKHIVIPGSVRHIDDNAFENTPEQITVSTAKGSFTDKWLKKHKPEIEVKYNGKY